MKVKIFAGVLLVLISPFVAMAMLLYKLGWDTGGNWIVCKIERAIGVIEDAVL